MFVSANAVLGDENNAGLRGANNPSEALVAGAVHSGRVECCWADEEQGVVTDSGDAKQTSNSTDFSGLLYESP
jgi:hypothetical protein